MKKVIAVVCAIVMLFALCVPAYALNSPVGQEKHSVTVKSNDTAQGTAEKTVLENGDVKAVASPADGYVFVYWKINGNKYTIVSGSLTSKEIVVTPLGDIELVAYFEKATAPDAEKPDGEKPDGETPDGEKPSIPGDDSPTSPETNDTAYLGAILAFVSLISCAVVLKKRAFN